MTVIKTQDCTACSHREPHPAPTHQGQIWYCNQNKFWVGDRVTNCTHFARRAPAAATSTPSDGLLGSRLASSGPNTATESLGRAEP